MSRLLWLLAWSLVAVWSLVCAAAYGTFDLAGGWFARNADLFSSDPEVVEWLFTAFSWLKSLSTAAVLVGWGVVSLLLLSVPWLLDRLAGTRPPPPPLRSAPAAPPRTAWPGQARDGVIDLSPDQYSVGPPPGGRSAGPAPRIPPRR